jgi:hypothetical protein
MMNFRMAAGPVLAALVMLVAVSPSQAQSSRRGAVTIAVMDDYPAFTPASGAQGAARRELKALVIRSSMTDPNSSVILLNPAYLNAATIDAALSALSTCPVPAAGASRTNIVAIPASAPAREVPAERAAAMRTRVTALQNSPRARVVSLGGTGRAVTIADGEVCR